MKGWRRYERLEKVRKVENRTARDRATEPREQNEPNSDGPSHGTTRTERNIITRPLSKDMLG